MLSVPTYARRFVISDVALNIAPDTDQKRDICQNAIGFARALGIDPPKVAVLAAVEMVQTKMPATLDGAILAKMADREADGWRHRRSAARSRWCCGLGSREDPAYLVGGTSAADVPSVQDMDAGKMIYKNRAF